jgi:hypothetical protein
MKLGLTTLLAAALAALLLVPAAGAGPGNGNGNGKSKGNGPPAWAGGGGGQGGGQGGGRPAWAGKPADKPAKPDKPGRPEAPEADDDQPRHDNPAWICKFEREQMGAEAFADEYGTNGNKANAFGKCVSREAHDRDGVTPADEEEAPAPEDGETPAPDDEPADEETGEDETATAVQAFFRYLWPVLYA